MPVAILGAITAAIPALTALLNFIETEDPAVKTALDSFQSDIDAAISKVLALIPGYSGNSGCITMSRESFLTSVEWHKMELELYAISDRLMEDAIGNALTRDPKAIVHAAGVIEGLRLAAKWPAQNLSDEDSPKPSADPTGTVDIRNGTPIVPAIPRLTKDTF